MMKGKIILFLLITISLISACGKTADQSASPPPPATPSEINSIPSLQPSATPPVLPVLTTKKGPYLILTGDPSQMKICWQLEDPGIVNLDFGTDETYSGGHAENEASNADDLNCVLLTGLQPETRYYYRLRNVNAEITNSFISAPSEADPDLVFWGYGDTRSGAQVHDSLDAEILGEIGGIFNRPALVFNTGDLMDTPTEESLQSCEFDNLASNSRLLMAEVPVVNIMGNHDGTNLFMKYFPYPYTDSLDWSFDYGPAHFVVIDLYSNTDENAPRWTWLRNDLENSTKTWKFILLHEPGWSAGPHENNEVVQKIIHPIAARFGVSIVFAGHNHYYSRAEVDHVTYITTGGGGAELYDPEYGWPLIITSAKANHYVRVEIKGNELNFTALSLQSEILDQFTIIKE